MPKGIFNVPLAENEPVLSYAPGTPEREALQAQLKAYKQTEVDIPMYIGGQEVRTGNKVPIHPHTTSSTV